MKRIVIGTVLALAVASTSVAADRKADRRYVDLYNRLASTVADHFYDPGLNGSNWSTVVRHYRPRLKGVRSDADFQRLAGEMLKELASPQVELHAPDDSDETWAGIGVDAWRMGKDLVIGQVDPLSDARRQGLKPGEIILSDRTQLIGPAGSAASVRVRGCDGAERLVTVRREGVEWPSQQPSFRWSVLRAGEGRSIGYLRVDSFGDDGAALADRAMADLKTTDALIVDVRFNSGPPASALRLASYFTDGPQPGLVLLSREWLARNGSNPDPARVLGAPRVTGAYTSAAVAQALAANGGAAALWTEDLGSARYTRPVIVLQGERTGSAGQGFAWLMKLKTRAVIMGRKTTGGLQGAETFQLGDGWSVTLPVHGIWAADGATFAARPAVPSVVVPTSRAALCAGRDADLEAAIDRITGARPAV